MNSLDSRAPSKEISSVFVYGTLKLGQLREGAWPLRPLAVVAAVTRGSLYDLGDFPALMPGSDLVTGEIWRFAVIDIPRTLKVLDAIEGFYGQPSDLYARLILSCRLESGQSVRAYGYQFAQDLPLEASRIGPTGGHCSWPPLARQGR